MEQTDLLYRNMRWQALSQNVPAALKQIGELRTIISEHRASELDVSKLTSDLIVALTETDDAGILSEATGVSKQFLAKIRADIADFSTEQLPVLFASLQLFAVEPGQYGFETVEYPDSDVNRLTCRYDRQDPEYLEKKEAYRKARDMLADAKHLRALAISALFSFFERAEFLPINDYIRDELFPMIAALNDDKRYRPFRTSLAANIADKIIRQKIHKIRDIRVQGICEQGFCPEKVGLCNCCDMWRS
jgi:hypothetical protein